VVTGESCNTNCTHVSLMSRVQLYIAVRDGIGLPNCPVCRSDNPAVSAGIRNQYLRRSAQRAALGSLLSQYNCRRPLIGHCSCSSVVALVLSSW